MLYLEPRVDHGRLEANIARTQLLIDHQPLPWDRWGHEFAAAMPNEILRPQEHAALADGVPRREAIRSRVTPLIELYRLSRYRSPRDPDNTSAARLAETAAPADPSGRPGPAAGEQAPNTEPDTESTMAPPDPGGRGDVDLPHVAWISRRDGTRPIGDLEDQAARYRPARHELTINADFRAITDMKTYWRERYAQIPGARVVIDAQVTEWCEQILTEVVLAARSSTWTEEQFDALLSPTALSAALLPRQLLHGMLQKRLGQKLGAPPRRQHQHQRPHRISKESDRTRLRAKRNPPDGTTTLAADHPVPKVRMSRSEYMELDERAVDAIASRVVERLLELLADRDSRPQHSQDVLLDANELAAHLGVSRQWVYQHAHELGVKRLGNGPRPRVRFPPDATITLDPASEAPQPAGDQQGASEARRGLIPVRDD